MKSWELRKAEAGNLDLVQYVVGIYPSITWSNCRGQSMFCWMSSCSYSVVSVTCPLCLTCIECPCYLSCDRSESTLQKQVIKLQAQMERGKKKAIIKKYFLSLQNYLCQDLQMVFLYFRNMCQHSYMSPKSDGEWSSSEELLQRELTWWM